jgi:hypothetical protein
MSVAGLFHAGAATFRRGSSGREVVTTPTRN